MLLQSNPASKGPDNPTYLKNGLGDKVSALVGLGVTGFGTLFALSKHSNMAFGTGKEE